MVAVEHLNLEVAEQEHAAVAAPLAVALHLGRRRELDVQLHVGELLLGPQHALAGLQHAAFHRPRRGRSVGHLPRAEIVARAEQHDRIGRRGDQASLGRRRRDDRRIRPRSVVHAPLAVRLHRRVVVADRRLLARCGGRQASSAMSMTDVTVCHRQMSS